MGKYIVLSKNLDKEIKYISNTSPLLWTDDRNKAKIFISEGSIMTDLYDHLDTLNKMCKELGLEISAEKIP